jgi:hypothetical protein
VDQKDFRSIQREMGARPEECPQCFSTAIVDMSCEDCGTDFDLIDLSTYTTEKITGVEA